MNLIIKYFLQPIAIISLLFCMAACQKGSTIQINTEGDLIDEPGMAEIEEKAQSIVNKQANKPIIDDKELFINGLLSKMTLEEKVGQMFFCAFETDGDGAPLTVLDDKTKNILKKYKIGGVIYFASNINSIEQTVKLSEDYQSNSVIPLFIDVDEEGGRVTRITKSENMPIKNTPTAKTIGNTNISENAYTIYEIIANELKALGINACFAPVADLDSNNTGAIGDRAFGDNPHAVGEFVVKAIEAFNDNGVINAVKHFPGHGIAPGDTHDEKIVSDKSLKKILDNDIIPFEMAINAGASMIMLSHITVPEWGEPTSMSKDAIDLIRNNMDFNGIIITDSYSMGAITNYYTSDIAAKNAVVAGVDMLLMPADLDKSFNSVLSAVKNDEIKQEQINGSVRRILSAKYDYGLFNKINTDVYRKKLDEYITRFYNNNEDFF